MLAESTFVISRFIACFTAHTYLHVIWQEDGTGQTASNATAYVDDANPQPARQLLQVSHHKDLEEHCDQQLQETATDNTK